MLGTNFCFLLITDLKQLAIQNIHNTEYDGVMQRRPQDEEKKGTAQLRETTITESFSNGGLYPGTERERERGGVCLLATFITVADRGRVIHICAADCVSMFKQQNWIRTGDTSLGFYLVSDQKGNQWICILI